MKNSEIYRKAQIVIVNSISLPAEEKLEIIRKLRIDEDSAKYWEEKEEKENGKV